VLISGNGWCWDVNLRKGDEIPYCFIILTIGPRRKTMMCLFRPMSVPMTQMGMGRRRAPMAMPESAEVQRDMRCGL
jgi:hypothetical protein